MSNNANPNFHAFPDFNASMKTMRILGSILGAVALAAAPVHALPFNFQFQFPTGQNISCPDDTENLGSENNGPLQFSLPTNFWTVAFGCMGSGTGSPKNFVMTFLPYEGPTYHCTVNWEPQEPSCPPSSVPDGGSTVALLGATLVGFAALRRRRTAKA